MQRLLIVGSGDVARRAVTWLAQRFRVFALVRPENPSASDWRALGACPVAGDLDWPESLARLAGLADRVLHLAPPQAHGARDERTRHLLAALSRGGSLPRRLVYVSTTGVYGDCSGARIDETRPRRPLSAPARRRLDAENCLRRWGAAHRVSVVLLRAPGIYAMKDKDGAGERLPRARLEAGLPVLFAAEDVYSNHIHADDLARACCHALFWGGAGRSFNVVDASDLRMGDYFDAVADYLHLPRPPRCPRADLRQRLSPVQWRFMQESRRIENTRLTRELRLRLLYPKIDLNPVS
ncbi:MAG: NAD-dependent epimerase/dehydratase family protein [Zoogloeaceae bacterium]|nr:NAD-dependent epimerase/dehydratase family protein [Zoogloeaceae bacterium]